MNLTTSRITAAAGVGAVIAGTIYAGVQINHPPADVEHLVTTEFFVRETAKAVMAVLALAGFAGMFLANRHRFGRLGVTGYVLVSVGYLAMFANQCIVGFVLPTVAKSDPGYVQDYLDAAMGGSAKDLGHMQELFMVTGMGYSLGGLLFGIALYRAGVLSRWASALFAGGTLAALALAALPEGYDRPFAVPVGVALVGLGYSLWTDSRTATHTATRTAHDAVVEPAAR